MGPWVCSSLAVHQGTSDEISAVRDEKSQHAPGVRDLGHGHGRDHRHGRGRRDHLLHLRQNALRAN